MNSILMSVAGLLLEEDDVNWISRTSFINQSSTTLSLDLCCNASSSSDPPTQTSGGSAGVRPPLRAACEPPPAKAPIRPPDKSLVL